MPTKNKRNKKVKQSTKKGKKDNNIKKKKKSPKKLHGIGNGLYLYITHSGISWARNRKRITPTYKLNPTQDPSEFINTPYKKQINILLGTNYGWSNTICEIRKSDFINEIGDAFGDTKKRAIKQFIKDSKAYVRELTESEIVDCEDNPYVIWQKKLDKLYDTAKAEKWDEETIIKKYDKWCKKDENKCPQGISYIVFVILIY